MFYNYIFEIFIFQNKKFTDRLNFLNDDLCFDLITFFIECFLRQRIV